MARRRKAQHGGARRGAGRPREFEDKQQLIVVVQRAEAEAVWDLADAADETVSAYLRRLVQRHLRAKGLGGTPPHRGWRG